MPCLINIVSFMAVLLRFSLARMVDILACKNIQVLLACRWHVFAGRKNEDRLAAAYDSFHNWCVVERKNPP